MNKAPKRYHAFLLRLWPELPDGWRATLEDARTGQRLGFASLEQLFAHLLHLAERGVDGEPGGSAEPPPPPEP
jgi:hypothetical protein